jgi:hypothetical protein
MKTTLAYMSGRQIAGTIELDSERPYYNVARLLVAAAGNSIECYHEYFKFSKKFREFASWFWSNISPEHDPAKKPILDKINAAQGIDLDNWYWANV